MHFDDCVGHVVVVNVKDRPPVTNPLRVPQNTTKLSMSRLSLLELTLLAGVARLSLTEVHVRRR
jgi:hypothetical protein